MEAALVLDVDGVWQMQISLLIRDRNPGGQQPTTFKINKDSIHKGIHMKWIIYCYELVQYTYDHIHNVKNQKIKQPSLTWSDTKVLRFITQVKLYTLSQLTFAQSLVGVRETSREAQY